MLLLPSKLLEFFFCTNELHGAVLEQNTATTGLNSNILISLSLFCKLLFGYLSFVDALENEFLKALGTDINLQ